MKNSNEQELIDLLSINQTVNDDGFSDSVMRSVKNEADLLSIQKVLKQRSIILTLVILLAAVIFGAGTAESDMLVESIESFLGVMIVFFVSFVWLMTTE